MIRTLTRKIIPHSIRADLRKRYLKYRYAGDRYQCPFCESQLSLMKPFGFDFPVLKEKEIIGGGRRENALCPVCGSFDRERLLYLFLLYRTDLFKGEKKVLHVAPEKHVAEILYRENTIDYLTADLLAEEVMVKMDITKIQYPDQTFDVVICNHVLEHVPDDLKAMKEIHRVLKEDGWAVLQVPFSPVLKETYEDSRLTTEEERSNAFGQPDHVRIYGKDYKDRLKKAGFKVREFHWTKAGRNFGGDDNPFGLNREEPIFFVKK